MEDILYRLPKLENFVLAVTPSNNRQDLLERQYTVFLEPYRTAKRANPKLPNMAWVIVDESPEPSPFFEKLNETDLLYLHVPSRTDLSPVQAQFQAIVKNHLYSEAALKDRLHHIQTKVCDRVKSPLDFSMPTIGELRNIALAAAVNKYGLKNDEFMIFTKDDDDFSSPELVGEIFEKMKVSSFVKPANMVIYQGRMDKWYSYDMCKQNEPALCIYNGETAPIDRYIVWNDAAQTKESEYGHMEMLGTLFSYRHSAYKAVSESRLAENQLAGGFEPVSWREDHLFARRLFLTNGFNTAATVDNNPNEFGRLVARNTAKTICHGDLLPADVASRTLTSLYYLAQTHEFADYKAEHKELVRSVFAETTPAKPWADMPQQKIA